eukprot:XP_011670270.1 PREDICTED: deleted in malignant brain tumors 1 protein-like [Strongylocentrotus purpuratus]
MAPPLLPTALYYKMSKGILILLSVARWSGPAYAFVHTFRVRMLGFDGALAAPQSARFGQGSGDIFGILCWGTYDSLANCFRREEFSCRHHKDAGAVCYSGAHPNPLQVRLVGGSNDAEGRVEIMQDGSWGTICDESWDLRDARVVCRMLGFDGALEAPVSARFGQGSGRILLANVGSHPQPFQVRLIGGSNDAKGRVEVLHDGSWGTICDDSWDLRDARVVCRMLGFDGVLDAPRSARFGQGSGPVFLAYVGCEGTEGNLADCAHGEIEYYHCSHTKDAGAVCYSGAHPNPFQVHLVGGSNDAEGRVEVLHDGSWGTICDDSWDLRDARVVCRMMGFDGALEAPVSARFGQGSGRILLVHVECEGTEGNLADSHPNPFQVRLFGGSNDAEGTVEVMHDGSWGTICDYSWDLRDARVVCRMLGFDGSLDAPISARFGQGSSRILLLYVECEGTEDNLADCAHEGVERYSCSHTRDAGAVCYPGRRVEFLYSESWRTVCGASWDLRDVRVVCRILGFDGALAASRSARFGQGSGDVLRVDCWGTEDSLADCPYFGASIPCGHHMDAGAVCYLGGTD